MGRITLVSVAGLLAVLAGVGTWARLSFGEDPPKQAPPVEVKHPAGCAGLPDHERVRTALAAAVAQGKASNSGMGNHQWAALVDRDGLVCVVAFSGPDRGAQWPGSRAIAAEKAHTANALSSPNFALSTANLYFSAQPGQSLFSLVGAAPPNGAALYNGDPASYGQANDPLVGKPVGGVIVFGGGLALYDGRGGIVGGLGVSGDTSCADHVVAWKIRHALDLDAVPGGPAPGSTDNMILDIQNGVSPSAFGHPGCRGGEPPEAIVAALPEKLPPGKKK